MEFDVVLQGDCFEIMSGLPDSSVNLIISDWPYYKVKAVDWDRQWATAEEYLDWIGAVCAEYRRILKPNGSLYAFASPKLAAWIELKMGDFFNVLSRITWSKPKVRFPHSQLNPKSAWRNYYPWAEIIFFAEHYGADNAAKGESGYGAKCDELRGFVFESLRAYLDGERRRANINFEQVRQIVGCADGSGLPSHWFTKSQWMLPTVENYDKLQGGFNQQGRHPAPPYKEYHAAPRSRFERDHSEREYLRAEYEDLRAEYEYLRRPFSISAQDQYTDVWEFPTVKAYPGKHPCEKPLEMYFHIIRVSSREGDVVADFFCGSGVTAEAARKLGRRYICSDAQQKWIDFAKQRIEQFQIEMAF